MKVVIYARQSSGAEENSASIEAQIKACAELAKKENLDILETFSDENFSGKTYPDTPEARSLAASDGVYLQWLSTGERKRKSFRPELGRLFSLLPEVDYVMVYDFTRLMRPLTDSFLESFIKQKLLQNKVKIKSVKEGTIDLATFSSSLVTSLEARINDNQILISKQKSVQALRNLQDSGYRYTGADFLGFRCTGRQKVEVVPEEMQIVKRIIQLINAGFSYVETCKIINSMDEAKRIYTYQDLIKVCNRLEYSGRCLNTKGDIIQSMVFPEVIPFPEIWQARQRINNKKKNIRNKSKIHPLSGLVFCGCCGKQLSIMNSNPMKGSTEKGKIWFYHCTSGVYTTTTPDGCRKSAIREFYQFPEKNGILQAVLPLLILPIEEELQRITAPKQDITPLLEKLEKIKKLEKKLDKKYMDGDITETEFEERFSVYKKEKKEIQNTIQQLSVPETDTEEELREACLLISTVGEIDPRLYRKLAQQFFSKIIVTAEAVEVFFTSGGSVSLPRLKDRNARYLPTFQLTKEKTGEYILTYFLKNADKENADFTPLWESEKIKIRTFG